MPQLIIFSPYLKTKFFVRKISVQTLNPVKISFYGREGLLKVLS